MIIGRTRNNGKEGDQMKEEIKVFIRAELTESKKGRLHKIIESGSGSKVKIPINKDGSVKWFDDNKLIKK